MSRPAKYDVLNIPGVYNPSGGGFFSVSGINVNDTVNAVDDPTLRVVTNSGTNLDPASTEAGFTVTAWLNSVGEGGAFNVPIVSSVVFGTSLDLVIDRTAGGGLTGGHVFRVVYDSMAGNVKNLTSEMLSSFNLLVGQRLDPRWTQNIPTPRNEVQDTPMVSWDMRQYTDDPGNEYDFAQLAGTPPAGIVLNSVTPGVYDGTPTEAGSFPGQSVRVTVKGGTENRTSSNFSFEVAGSGPGTTDPWVDETDAQMEDETSDDFEFITYE